MAGLYIHIPFCKKRCTYCDFHFSTTYESYSKSMVELMAEELKLRLSGNQEEIKTLYFGGGTPSLLTQEDWNMLMPAVQQYLEIKNLEEFTIECNPDDINESQLDFWKSLGVTRLSIGIQSFNDEDLKWMNRAHSAEMSVRSIELTKNAGFDNFTIDLIYGLPNQDLKTWENTLNYVCALGIPHISAYCLTVEERTVLFKWVDDGKLVLPDEEVVEAQFDLLCQVLQQHGIQQYEVSNFAKPGFEAVHNGNYWTGESYYGIGPSAHGKIGNTRYWNIANNMSYMNSIREAKLPETTEILTPENQFNEMVMTGLRTRRGVSLSVLETFIDLPENFSKQINNLEAKGVLERYGTNIRLSQRDLIKADYYASQLFIL